MTFKSSLLFLAMLVGGCYGSCNRTISGYTWKFNATVDKDYEDITKEECAEKCLSFSWCRGYTWSLDDSSGNICHIFHELNQQHACQECSKCESGVFKQISGVCSTEASNIIGIKQSSSEMSCIEMCAETPGCKYYSWGAGNIFSDKCFMYKMCDPKPSSCEAWQSGQLECVTNPTQLIRLPSQCTSYKSLTSANRKSTAGPASFGDKQSCTGSWKTNSEWKGASWYRIQGDAGTRVASAYPGDKHCGTYQTGWIRGSLPKTPGETVDREACFGYYNSDSCYSSWKKNIKITHCSTFMVYYLVDTNYCSLYAILVITA